MVRPSSVRRAGCLTTLCALSNRTAIHSPSGGALLQVAGGASEKLTDFKCPTAEFVGPITLDLGTDGWHIGNCSLRVKGKAILRGTGSLDAMITVSWGGTLEFFGDFEFRCEDCVKEHRAILAQGAHVIIHGRLEGRNFTAPEHSQDEMTDTVADERFLDHRDGGAIFAKSLQVKSSGELVLRDTTSPFGSGGAVAAERFVAEGHVYIDNALARIHGGGIAVRPMPRSQARFEKFWKTGSRSNPTALKGFDVSKSGKRLITTWANQWPRAYDVESGEELPFPVLRTPEEEKRGWHGYTRWMRDSEDTLVIGEATVGREQGIKLLQFNGTHWNKVRDVMVGELRKEDSQGDLYMAFSRDGSHVAVWLDRQMTIYEVTADGNWKRVDQKGEDEIEYPIVDASWSALSPNVLAFGGGHRLFRYEVSKGFLPSDPSDDGRFRKGCPYPAMHKGLNITGVSFRKAPCSECDHDMLAVTLSGSRMREERAFLYHVHQTATNADGCFKFEFKPLDLFAGKVEVTASTWNPNGQDQETGGLPALAWAESNVYNEHSVHFFNVQGHLDVHSKISFMRWIGDGKKLMMANSEGRFWVARAPGLVTEEHQDEAELKLLNLTIGVSRAKEGEGGGIYIHSGNLTLQNAVMNNASAFIQGCAIYSNYGAISIDGLIVGESSFCGMRSALMGMFENALGVHMEGIQVLTSGAKLAFTHERFATEKTKTPTNEAPGVDIQASAGPRGAPDQRLVHELCDRRHTSGQVSCRPGQETNTIRVSRTTCVVMCAKCLDGASFSPSKHRCIPCPLGLECARGSDLRNPVLAQNVSMEPVEESFCDGAEEPVNGSYYVTGYFKNESVGHKQCNKVKCAMRDSDHYGLQAGSGCTICPQGTISVGQGEQAQACQKPDIKFKDDGIFEIVNKTPGEVEVTVHVLPAAIVADAKVNCTLCQASDEFPWSWSSYLTRFEGADKCISNSSVGTVEGSFTAKFHTIQGFWYSGHCTLTYFSQTIHTPELLARSKWSFATQARGQDKVLTTTALLTSCALIVLIWYTNANLKKKWVTCGVLCGLLAGHLVIAFLAWDSTDNGEGMWCFWVALVGGIIAATELAVITLINAKRRRDEFLKNTTDEALSLIKEVQFPVTLLRADDFLMLGKLLPHEELRQMKKLYFFDTVAKAKQFLDGEDAKHDGVPDDKKGNFGVFFSHQWTAWDHPDPSAEQYRSMKAVINHLVDHQEHELTRMYVWVDYFSIPQANPHIQRLAINSLPIYASLLQVFVIVTPELTHSNTNMRLTKDTYQERGWCRAEQLCHYVKCGTDDMYLAKSDGRPIPLKGLLRSSTLDADSFERRRNSVKDLESWFEQMLFVFSKGVCYTCCRLNHEMNGKTMPCDREALMLPMLGLYGEIFQRREEEGFREIYDRIRDEGLDEIFPPVFEYRTKDFTETRQLFAELIEHMECTLRKDSKLEVAAAAVRPPPS